MWIVSRTSGLCGGILDPTSSFPAGRHPDQLELAVWAEVGVQVPPGPTDAASAKAESSTEPPGSCWVGIATQLPTDSTETTREAVPTSTVSHLFTSSYCLRVTGDSRVKFISMLAALTLGDEGGGC